MNRVSIRAYPEQKLEALPALGVIRVGLSYCGCLKVIIPWLWQVCEVCHSVLLSGSQPVGLFFFNILLDLNLPVD